MRSFEYVSVFKEILASLHLKFILFSNTNTVWCVFTGSLKVFYNQEHSNEAITDTWMLKNFTNFQVFGECYHGY